MPSVELTVSTSASPAAAWDFVQEMDNWAPFITGYQQHEKLSERESIWMVKGELGGLTRIAEFRVRITQWNGPERVSFLLEGLSEPVTGSGGLSIAPSAADGVGESAPRPPAPGLFARLRDWLARGLLRTLFGAGPAPATRAATATGSDITFQLELNAGGATGPILNLLLAPMLKPVAEDFASKIVGHLEAHAPLAAIG